MDTETKHIHTAPSTPADHMAQAMDVMDPIRRDLESLFGPNKTGLDVLFEEMDKKDVKPQS